MKLIDKTAHVAEPYEIILDLFKGDKHTPLDSEKPLKFRASVWGFMAFLLFFRSLWRTEFPGVFEVMGYIIGTYILVELALRFGDYCNDLVKRQSIFGIGKSLGLLLSMIILLALCASAVMLLIG